MYTLRPIPLSQATLWDNFASTHQYTHFTQSTAWMRFKMSQRWEAYRFGVFSSNGTLVAGSCVYSFTFADGSSFLHLQGGPLLSYATDDEQSQWDVCKNFFRSLTKKKLYSHIRIEPQITHLPVCFHDFQQSYTFSIPPETVLIDLTKSQSELFQACKPKTRYNIGLAQRKGVTISIEKMTDKTVRDFYEIFEVMTTRKKLKKNDLALFQALNKTCASLCTVINAHKDSTLIASAILLTYGEKTTYLYGASHYEYRALQAPSLLQWASICHAKNCGSTLYDMYGISTQNQLWSGISRFKEQFGGKITNFIGTYDWILNPHLYSKSQANTLSHS